MGDTVSDNDNRVAVPAAGRWTLAALALIVLGCFVVKLYLITREPLIGMLDAGYYVRMINNVLATGFHGSGDPPLAFYWAALFAWLCGDVMLGYKIAMAIAAAAIALPVFAIVRHVGKRDGAALFAALAAAFAAPTAFMMWDLLKNTMGLLFGACFLYFILLCVERFNRRDAALAIASLVLMLSSHFSSGAYVVLCTMPFLALYPAAVYLRKRKLTDEALFCLFLLTAILLAGFLLAFVFQKFGVGESGVGPVGLHGEALGEIAGLDQRIIAEYAVLFALGLAGLWGIRKESARAMLFLSWLAVGFLLTQTFLVDSAWAFRFGWDGFLVLAVLAGLGMAYLAQERRVYAGALALASLLVLYWFMANPMVGAKPVITLEDWNWLRALHASNPEIGFTGMGSGAAWYWVEAAGFTNASGGGYRLLCRGQAGESPGGGESCIGITTIPNADAARLQAEGKVAASSERFIVVRAEDYVPRPERRGEMPGGSTGMPPAANAPPPGMDKPL